MKDSDKVSEKKIGRVLLILILLVQLCLYVFLFVTVKTAHHEDEFFSYGMANSYDRPFLYGSGYSVYDNYNTRMTGRDFWNYITVRETQRFRYDVVWENQKADTHPPLYYMLIHTIASCFPESFSWWWAFLINLCAFVISQIFLYRLVKRVSARELPALLVCALWGFSVAGQNTHLFLRMYALQTMFCILFVWFMQKMITTEKQRVLQEAVPLALVVAGGALTQHLFLVFAFFYTMFVCIYEGVRRKWKHMFFAGLSVLAGVVVSVLIFPATIQHLFGGNSVVWHGEAGVFENLRFILILAFGELTGILMHMKTGQNALDLIFVLAAFAVPVLLLYRKRKGGQEKETSESYTPLFLYYTILCYLLLVAKQIYYGEFGMETDRYTFCLMPLMCVIVIPFLENIAGKLSERFLKQRRPGKLTAVLCVVVLLALQNRQPLFRNYLQDAAPENGKVEEYVAGHDVLFMCSPILQPCFCLMLADAEDIYTALPYDEDYRTDVKKEDLDWLMKKGNFFLVVDSAYKQGEELMNMLQYYAEMTGTAVYYCTSETTHGVRVDLYEFCK